MRIVEAVDLTKVYRNRYIALNALNCTIEKGMVYGLVGPNGAGKSTTFRLLLGLHRPTAGHLRLFGQPMDVNHADLRRRIGYLPTNPSFPRDMTPISYLQFLGNVLGLGSDTITIRLAKLLQMVDLTQDASRRIDGLSTGMLTRLGIAAALMNDPELLILDEPTSGLDPSGRKRAIELIRELAGHDRTIILATHILSDVERVCTDIGIISQGRLIYEGPMTEMRRLARQRILTFEIEGNITGFEYRLHELDSFGAFRAERTGSEFRITFLGTEPMAAYVQRVLALVERTGVELLHLDTGSHEIEEAFMQRLDDDRRSGFLRAAAWAASQQLDEGPLAPRIGEAPAPQQLREGAEAGTPGEDAGEAETADAGLSHTAAS